MWCGFYRRGFMKEKKLVIGAYMCVVYVSLCKYDEKINSPWRLL
jgi:putative methionine-R-sulfoxide reductase with GAF domain